MANKWLTPATIPAVITRRVLLIPDSYEWRGVIRGMLYELSQPYNWEQYGAITPEQVADIWRDIFEQFDLGEECP